MAPVGEQDWRQRLAQAVADGVACTGPAGALEALRDEIERLSGPAEPSPLEVRVPVLGVDACKGGWVGVLLSPARPAAVLAAATIAALVELARESADLAVVAIDIPIGLPDDRVREADTLARRALPGKGSSVFTTLTRSAYEAPTYAEAREANLVATGGTQSASAQAYALRARILDVDGWLRSRPAVEVIEVHPELAFARMTGTPVRQPKSAPEGITARRAALGGVGLVPPAWFRGSGFAEDDLLDACAAAWTAVRHSRGESESFPDEPELFSDGIPAAIRV